MTLGYSRKTHDPWHFPTDGAAGEHICSMAVGVRRFPLHEENPDELAEYLEITTNWGRQAAVGLKEKNMEMRKLLVAPGTSITGLYGSFVSYSWIPQVLLRY
ncbi:Cyclin-like F-box [Cordyceps fumosorosea ARSEF 2679]|uniref:Cyclin-like F-box n=1 Tax=Cordyceps fumosorosea (strain ARSEF 2679) TaxID=1081104 RepID=A0A162IYV0_CORFA|nr:Cyclin-like F-box [Cordyceps fumosorosea ARSEF 2679]OAA54192.1 Cyclin-like F-box [Cordyceps fumosorosea ARSEF 2679]